MDIVDGLEAVQIDHVEGQHLVALGLGQADAQILRQATPVGQPRQCVGARNSSRRASACSMFKAWSASDSAVHAGHKETLVRAAEEPPQGYSTIVQRVAPSVVTVFTSKKGSQDGLEVPHSADPGLRDLFGEQLPREGDREAHGLGSGVIVSAEGEILTRESRHRRSR